MIIAINGYYAVPNDAGPATQLYAGGLGNNTGGNDDTAIAAGALASNTAGTAWLNNKWRSWH